MTDNLVKREVTKPLTIREKGKYVTKDKGCIVLVSPENAEIFKDRLCEPGNRPKESGAEMEEAIARIDELEAENARLQSAIDKLQESPKSTTKPATRATK